MEVLNEQDPFNLLCRIAKDIENNIQQGSSVEGYGKTWSGLAFTLEQKIYLSSLEQIVEVKPYAKPTQVPGVKTWLKGVVNYRGDLLPITDLSGFSGGAPLEPTKTSKILVVSSLGNNFGLLVESVLGLRKFSYENKLPLGKSHDLSYRPYLICEFEGEDEENRWPIFDLESVINNPQFHQVANRGHREQGIL